MGWHVPDSVIDLSPSVAILWGSSLACRHMGTRGLLVSIRELRKAHGLTLTGLADRIKDFGLHVHPDTLSNIELGHKQASEPLVLAWSRALNVSPLMVFQATRGDAE